MLTEENLLEIIKNYTIYPNSKNKEISTPFIEFRDTFETENGEIKYFDDVMMDDGRIYAIVGPSGSGKSTFIANLYNSGALGSTTAQFVPYLNRQIYNERFSQEKDRVYLKYEKAKKEHLAKNHKSFLLESANFDDSYVDFLINMHKEYGSKINLIYITTQSMYENIKRVENRKYSEGGFGLKTRELNKDHVSDQLITDAKAVRKLAAITENLYFLDNSKYKPQLLAKKIGKNGRLEEAKCEKLKKMLAKAIFPLYKSTLFFDKKQVIVNHALTLTKNKKNSLVIKIGKLRHVKHNKDLDEIAATIMPDDKNITKSLSERVNDGERSIINDTRNSSLKEKYKDYNEKRQLKLAFDFIKRINNRELIVSEGISIVDGNNNVDMVEDNKLTQKNITQGPTPKK